MGFVIIIIIFSLYRLKMLFLKLLWVVRKGFCIFIKIKILILEMNSSSWILIFLVVLDLKGVMSV